MNELAGLASSAYSPAFLSVFDRNTLHMRNTKANNEGTVYRIHAEVPSLRLRESESKANDLIPGLIGTSLPIQRMLHLVRIVAPTNATVLIHGETGSGKELIARAIHQLSPRRTGAFVTVNCSAIPAGLLESELFGHEKGAFTGAIAQKSGRFQIAQGGSLFLDEIADTPLELQSKLLRVLQEREFERLGSTRTVHADVRIIAATNRDLAQLVADQQFRHDLYYRLNVFPVKAPSLRERPGDIPLLVRYFIHKFTTQMNKRITSIPNDSLARLSEYPWPGNVRELEHFIERAVILSPGPELYLPLAELELSPEVVPRALAALEDVEREHILRVLEALKWVIGGPNGAAATLGLKRSTLNSRLRKLGIARPSYW
jgi:formate hydrogenlyase transcriptional activator